MEDLIKKSLKEEKIIADGGDGIILYLNQELVAKLYWDNRKNGHKSPEALARKEFEIGKNLFQNGVYVPEMINVFSFDNPIQWVLVMERLQGANLTEFFGRKIPTEIEKKRRKQIGKAKSLGYKPSNDSHANENAIYCPKEKRVYLIDFVDWEYQEK